MFRCTASFALLLVFSVTAKAETSRLEASEPSHSSIAAVALGNFASGPETATLPGERLETNGSTRLGASFGVLGNLELNPLFSAELGLFSLNRNIADSNGRSQNDPWLESAALARVWPLQFLSIGLGPYAAYYVGGHRAEREIKPDFGIVGSVSGKYEFSRPWFVTAEARYQKGLVDVVHSSWQQLGANGQVGDASLTQRFSDFQTLVGIGYSL